METGTYALDKCMWDFTQTSWSLEGRVFREWLHPRIRIQEEHSLRNNAESSNARNMHCWPMHAGQNTLYTTLKHKVLVYRVHVFSVAGALLQSTWSESLSFLYNIQTCCCLHILSHSHFSDLSFLHKSQSSKGLQVCVQASTALLETTKQKKSTESCQTANKIKLTDQVGFSVCLCMYPDLVLWGSDP